METYYVTIMSEYGHSEDPHQKYMIKVESEVKLTEQQAIEKAKELFREECPDQPIHWANM